MEFGKLTAVFDADTRKFDAGFRSVEKGIASVTTGLGKTTSSVNQLTGELAPATGRLDNFSGSLGQMAGISVIAASAIGGVVTGILTLAKSTAEYESHLQDLNDQTGIGVENLSALKLAFDESGGSIDSGATALTKYLKSVSDANTGNDTLRKKFLEIGFTVDDLNTSYGDSDKAVEILVKRVGEMSNSQDRLNALQKVGVRNAQELNGAIVQMKGDLVKFREEAERLGLVITPEQAKAADDFDESLNLLTKQIKGMSFSIAHQYMPEISGAIGDVSNSLANNRGAWAAWGDFVKTEIRGVRVAAAFLGSVFEALRMSGGTLPGIAFGLGIAGGVNKSRELHAQDDVGGIGGVGAGIFRTKGLGGGGGGGGGGRGGGGGSAKQDPAVQLLKQLEDQFRNLTPRTEAQKVAEQLLSKEFDKTSDSIKKKILITAMDIDAQKMVLAVTRERTVAGEKEREEFEKMVDLVREMNLTRRRTMNDLSGLFDTSATRRRSIADGATRPRIATVDEQVARDQIAKIREEMSGLGGDLTSIFRNSVGDGFKQGVDQGLATLAQGLLHIVEDIFLKRLATGLSGIFDNLATTAGSGGGGFWGGLLRAIFGGAVSGAAGGLAGSISLGGGSSFTPGGTGLVRPRIVGRAIGGPVSAMTPYMVGERGPEMFVPQGSGNIIPNGKGQVVHNHYNTFNIAPIAGQSYSAKRSARQQADMILAALQGARA